MHCDLCLDILSMYPLYFCFFAFTIHIIYFPVLRFDFTTERNVHDGEKEGWGEEVYNPTSAKQLSRAVPSF